MRRPLVTYDFANYSILNFRFYEENLIFFFISVDSKQGIILVIPTYCTFTARKALLILFIQAGFFPPKQPVMFKKSSKI
jgi:hypothetical protein